MLLERKIGISKIKEKSHTYDDVVSKDIVSSGVEYEDASQTLCDLETMRKRNGKLLQKDIIRLSLKETWGRDHAFEIVEQNNAKKISRLLKASLIAAVGAVAAKDISKRFIHSAGNMGHNKAAKELIKDVVKAGKKYIGAGKKHGEISLFHSKKNKKNLRTGGHATKEIAAKLDVKREKMISGALKRTGKEEKTSLKHEIKDKILEKKASRHVKLGYLIDRQMRALRRAARRMRANARRIRETAASDANISMNANARNASQTLSMDLNAINRFADMGEQMLANESNMDAAAMQLDSILREGRASMAVAQVKAGRVDQGLLYHRDNQKTRA
ncbi:MAG: hypothetical protein KAJ75_08930 [Alphaproteobacteria bacterium]|nr:hypothetical protein [Alphaproteobacteria bacterium]